MQKKWKNIIFDRKTVKNNFRYVQRNLNYLLQQIILSYEKYCVNLYVQHTTF